MEDEERVWETSLIQLTSLFINSFPSSMEKVWWSWKESQSPIIQSRNSLSSFSTPLSGILIPLPPTPLSPNHISFTLKSNHLLNDGGERDEMMMLRNDWRRNWSLRWSYEHHEMINESSESLSSLFFFMKLMSFILLIIDISPLSSCLRNSIII